MVVSLAEASSLALASTVPPSLARKVNVTTGTPARIAGHEVVVASTAAMLEDVGHVVSEALSGVHALDLLRLGTKVDVVVTDHAMPGMTGSELARQIRQH